MKSHIIYSTPFIFGANKSLLGNLYKTYNNIVKKVLTTDIKTNRIENILDQSMFKLVDNILNKKYPNPLFVLLNDRLSKRKSKYFILFRKPKKKLCFLYNLLLHYNSFNSKK